MSRINIRHHKKQFPFLLNSFSTAIQKCKYYPLMMSGYSAQQARMHSKLDNIILEICMLSPLSYEHVMSYVRNKSTETGYMAIDIAYNLREKALDGKDMIDIIVI